MNLDKNAIEKILSQQYSSLAALYGPALATMTQAEILALSAMIANKLFTSAQELVRSKMSLGELADEKIKLTEMAAQMADTAQQRAAIMTAIGEAILRTVLGIALAMVGL